MEKQIVGAIPEFTQDEAPVQTPASPEPAEVTPEAAPEKETLPPPPEGKPTEPPEASDNTPVLSQDEQRELQGLRTERVNLLKEITDLRGTKRDLKQEELRRVDERIDELKDLNPDDVSIIDRVLRAKGYITKQEASQMSYEATKTEELGKFLERYPEYKPENDSGDVNWTALQREISYYKMPEDPRKISEILERAHRSIAKVPSGQPIAVRQRQIEVAGAGKGGVQRPSESKSLDPHQRAAYAAGGWTEEEISQIEKRL